VEALNKAGYSCAGIDNRGCGRSAGLFGYVNDHTDWVNDVVSSEIMHVLQSVC
jgi:alpha-beta hydrolase superfamily lysophospholipase